MNDLKKFQSSIIIILCLTLDFGKRKHKPEVDPWFPIILETPLSKLSHCKIFSFWFSMILYNYPTTILQLHYNQKHNHNYLMHFLIFQNSWIINEFFKINFFFSKWICWERMNSKKGHKFLKVKASDHCSPGLIFNQFYRKLLIIIICIGYTQELSSS